MSNEISVKNSPSGTSDVPCMSYTIDNIPHKDKIGSNGDNTRCSLSDLNTAATTTSCETNITNCDGNFDCNKTVDVDDDDQLNDLNTTYSRIRTDDVKSKLGKKFEDFFLRAELLKGIKDCGFFEPTPIQELIIPKILDGESVLARSKNGTGKTAAYMIPLIEKIKVKLTQVQAIVLVPSRELAMQISAFAIKLGSRLNIKVVLATGGTNLKEDVLRLYQAVHVVVATPGKLFDLTNRRYLRLNCLKMFVLDEADRLLEGRMLVTTETYISQFIKKTNSQIVCVSATFPQDMMRFKEDHMPNALCYNTMDELCLIAVKQYYAFVREEQKLLCLKTLLTSLKINQCIIFCNSIQRVELLAYHIVKLGLSCFYLHGKLSQEYRNKVFDSFRKQKNRCLVCTDLMTRGVDVQNINVVINFDMPETSATYLHRIGRCGRYGNKGIVVSLITYDDRELIFKIENEINSEIKPLPSKVNPAYYVY